VNLSILILFIPLIPLLGALALRLLGARMGKAVVGAAATSTVALSFALSLAALASLSGMDPSARHQVARFFTWAPGLGGGIGLDLLLDPLSAVMILVVTGVGSLIHLYSTGYMREESAGEYARYFAYLNFFIFSMLLLVLSANFLVLFAGWELVGLSSYLLIGFFRSKTSAADAGKKAFIVNRVGDLGFLMGLLAILAIFGSLDYGRVLPQAATVLAGKGSWATLIALALFLGAMGKSAQVPLHVWLPDAMEGPTPVSALIHAATMVTAGVFMVARCHALFELSATAMAVVAWVGAVTALFAATIGLVQNDIKRVMAYSTLSQLGYMMLGVGVGAYTAGFFHLFTHAFFKALLFLGCGSVMHALHGELDLTRMGGLRAKMPVTFWTFLVGALCLAGFPLTSGFFSKDEILWEALASPHGSALLWAIGAFTSLLTAVYVSRLVFKVFFGAPRDRHLFEHAHESGWAMALPLVALALLALLAGLLGLPHAWSSHQPFAEWLAPVFSDIHAAEASALPPSLPWLLMGLYTLGILAGAGFCWWLFVAAPGRSDRLYALKPVAWLHRVLWNKYWVDEAYQALLVDGPLALFRWLWRWFDQGVLDGLVNFAGFSAQAGGATLRLLQTGYLRFYLALMALGAALWLALVFRLL
jgi:NADH-quinone oxidoreductase subunit L